jgi:outer membrane protein assembly factor BamB
VAVTLLWLARFGIKAVVPGFQGFAWSAQGGLIGAAAVLGWWAFFSRAPWRERVGAVVAMVAGLGLAWQARHESMGLFWMLTYAVPVLCLALVVWAAAARGLADGPRRAAMVATIGLACGVWTLLRAEGISGDHVASFEWRWTKSPEEKVLSQAGAEPMAAPQAASAANAGADWPGFRGAGRDSVVRGVRMATGWSTSPPMELWRRPVGPGWSSFAVRGSLLYTQEQRGEDEIVACYDATTGRPVWTHRDPARFFESNGGAGPRATPTLAGGHVYTLGATGILNALDAATGAVVWSRNVASDAKRQVPMWGFSSSPLLTGDLAIVAAGGQLLAYDRSSGEPRWSGRAGGGYSSPQLATIDGVEQVLLMRGAGAAGVAPADGTVLWEHAWKGSPIVQPAVTADGDVLIVASAVSGTRRLAVAQKASGWTVAERWTSLGLKPYFNDFVVHRGHAYGFDARILACIDLADGAREWKGGRYGSGQLVLLPEQDLLLVLSEEGEVALVSATPDRFAELARFKAIEGKTWNHPVVAGDVLLVRNGEEMAAFRLPLAGR